MIYFEKNPCPPEIAKELASKTSDRVWRSIPKVPAKSQVELIRKRFNSLNKSRLREALIADQFGLCAYCMAPITNDGKVTTIEHWYPLSKDKDLAMDYSNYLAVCNGGRNGKLRDGQQRVLCCDARKSNTVVRLDPRNRELMEGIAYHDDGRIYTRYAEEADNREIMNEIDNVFALNGKWIGNRRADTTTQVVKRRKDTYRAMDSALSELLLSGELTPEMLQARIDSIDHANPKPAFAGVELFVLENYKAFV